jgi:hypothetical protein
MISTVFQDAAVATRSLTLTDIAVTFTGFVLIGFWREMHSLKNDIRAWQAKINTTLFGPNADNGLVGTSKDHEHRLRDLEKHHES